MPSYGFQKGTELDWIPAPGLKPAGTGPGLKRPWIPASAGMTDPAGSAGMTTLDFVTGSGPPYLLPFRMNLGPDPGPPSIRPQGNRPLFVGSQDDSTRIPVEFQHRRAGQPLGVAAR